MSSDPNAGTCNWRRDRSLGWAALEAKQSAALRRELYRSSPPGACPGAGLASFLPPELLPFPPPARRRFSFAVFAKALLACLVAIPLCYALATSILINLYRWVDPPATVLMAYREWRYGWKVQPPKPVKLAKIPRYVKSMLVAIEDDKFYVHHGIDLEAIARAREIDKRLGKPLYGGSTLTMQVARTLFLVPEKSYVRKAFEVLTAFELEAFLPKTRILELYFGYAEWGKGIFGMEAAARKCYGRGVASLSRDEAARLIALLSSPIKYNPQTLRKSGILRERYAYLSSRYAPPEGEAAAELAPATSIAPDSAASGTSSGAASPPGAAGQGAQAQAATEAATESSAAPPPSLEPGVEVEAVDAAVDAVSPASP
jgi:Membrane carboxypeptidase (penicillin-binding protein)